MFTTLHNLVLNRKRYHTHPQAVIIACYYNPQRSPYRLLAFQKWYHSIKHLHHRILECTIGDDQVRQLPDTPYIAHVHTDSMLWHKETLLNKLIAALPDQYRYVFWLDTDILFTNQRWLPESVEVLQDAMILQPFKYCIHLDRYETAPSFDVEAHRATASKPGQRHPKLWRSFCANYVLHRRMAESHVYDEHGHVGFAWGARREVLDTVPLYDKALVGGADHIIAHAAACQLPHPCLETAFPDTLDDVMDWAWRFASEAQGRIGYVPGDLYHLWHGDLEKRQYLQRIRQFAPSKRQLTRDHHGFWIDPFGYDYMWDYYRLREAFSYDVESTETYAPDFETDMGYSPLDIGPRFPPPAEIYGEEEPVTETIPMLVEPETFTPLANDPALTQEVIDNVGPFS